MTEPDEDAAGYARRHAGERERRLTPEQRDLLGRVVARRIARGAKIETIGRAVAHALPELGEERAYRLGRDEALRALAWERLDSLRARGVQQVALVPAADACPTCRAAAGVYDLAAMPTIPIAGCTHAAGCRCLSYAADEAPPMPTDTPKGPPASTEPGGDAPVRPWYRPRPPRPHGPRWTDEERAGKGRRPRPPGTSPRRAPRPHQPDTRRPRR